MTPNDPDIPHQMRVCCYNVKDGCKNTVSYMGVKPVRKLCSICQESGAPSERILSGFSLEKHITKGKAPPVKGVYDYGGEPVFAVTCWPKTFSGGRVLPYRTT